MRRIYFICRNEFITLLTVVIYIIVGSFTCVVLWTLCGCIKLIPFMSMTTQRLRTLLSNINLITYFWELLGGFYGWLTVRLVVLLHCIGQGIYIPLTSKSDIKEKFKEITNC